MKSRSIWKGYVFLALAFLVGWLPFLIPAIEPLVATHPEFQLALLLPFFAAFVCGIKFGYQILAGTAVIYFAAASVVVLSDFEALVHDATLIAALGYAAGITLQLLCVVLLLTVAGAFLAKKALSVVSTLFLILVAGIGVYLIKGLGGEPIPYGWNYYTLKVLAVSFGATLVLILIRLLAKRFDFEHDNA